MKAQKILGLVCMVALAFPMLTSAEIYKWKDKNGVTRYSDTPPPVDVKVNTLRGSRASGLDDKTPPAVANKKAPARSAKETAVREQMEKGDPKSGSAARLRARNADTEKRNKQEKERAAELKKENCKAAKSNYATFSQGGRIYKTNANGEREYYGDDELKSQEKKAQSEMRKYC